MCCEIYISGDTAEKMLGFCEPVGERVKGLGLVVGDRGLGCSGGIEVANLEDSSRRDGYDGGHAEWRITRAGN